MLNDRELVRRVCDGSEEAAADFVDRFARFVYAILHRSLRLDRETADDLFQAVFVHLWDNDCRRLRVWRGDGDFASFLAPVVRNLALARLRLRHPQIGDDGFDEIDEPIALDPTPEEQAVVVEQRRRLARAVEQLRPRDRELYRLRYEDELRYRHIAEQLNITVNNVGVALARLERRLIRTIQGRSGPGTRTGSTTASAD